MNTCSNCRHDKPGLLRCSKPVDRSAKYGTVVNRYFVNPPAIGEDFVCGLWEPVAIPLTLRPIPLTADERRKRFEELVATVLDIHIKVVTGDTPALKAYLDTLAELAIDFSKNLEV